MGEPARATRRGATSCSGPRRLASIALVVLAALLVLPAQVGAATSGASEPVRLQGTVRIVGGPDALLQLDGATRYPDTLELLASPGVVVNELSIEDYVAGVAEMPARWPASALEAQAIAARTYAWWVMRAGAYESYDICATVACQVYRGAEPVLDDGERWRAAVDATAGQVLVDAAGAPILARYFSTSGGRTYANEDVFPSTGALPYLRAVDDPYDEVSPYHRWTVTFTRQEFDELLARGDTLHAAVPVAGVQRVGAVDDHAADVVVASATGDEVVVSALALRDFLNAMAPDSFPDRYPSLRADGLRRLPSTVPSSRFDLELDGTGVTLNGRGWGHGVGMGQYGARGRAEDGHDAGRILAAYYSGLQPTSPSELPDRVRVGLTGGTLHTVRGDRPVDLVVDGEVVVAGALGTWTFEREGDDWLGTPPEGTADALEVGDTALAEPVPSLVDAVTVSAAVNKPVWLRLQVWSEAGTLVLDRPLGVVDAGSHDATWRYVDDDGAAVSPGSYRIALVGTDAVGSTAGEPALVDVPHQGAMDGAGSAGAAAGGLPWRSSLVLAVAALAVVLVTAVVLLGRPRS